MAWPGRNQAAAGGFSTAYGDGALDRAVYERFNEIFEREVAVFFVATGRREPIVGVVGALQFDVITSRLRSEYNVEVQVEPATYTAARWLADPAVTMLETAAVSFFT